MKERKLRETLAELHRELERTEPRDTAARERVKQAAREIDAWLESAETSEQRAERPDEDADESVGDRLRDAAIRFEEEHPNLSATVRRVIDALSDLGI